MPYKNYRAKKEKGLVELEEKEVVNVISVGESEESQEKVDVFFVLRITKFNEDWGTARQEQERYELDEENLEREKTLFLGWAEDIKALQADIKAMRNKKRR